MQQVQLRDYIVTVFGETAEELKDPHYDRQYLEAINNQMQNSARGLTVYLTRSMLWTSYANEFASILVSLIEENLIPIVSSNPGNMIFWSDAYGAQNRNNILSNALLCVAVTHNITIIQKYLFKVRTQMEADSMHSAIERRLRNRDINVPADYVQYCKPRPYNIQFLTYEFFKDFSNIKYYNSIRPGRRTGDPVASDLKQLKYRPDGIIEYKLRHSGDWKQIVVWKNKAQQVHNFAELPSLYTERRKIKKEKFEHLQQLKHTLELDYHDFYDNIAYE